MWIRFTKFNGFTVFQNFKSFRSLKNTKDQTKYNCPKFKAVNYWHIRHVHCYPCIPNQWCYYVTLTDLYSVMWLGQHNIVYLSELNKICRPSVFLITDSVVFWKKWRAIFCNSDKWNTLWVPYSAELLWYLSILRWVLFSYLNRLN